MKKLARNLAIGTLALNLSGCCCLIDSVDNVIHGRPVNAGWELYNYQSKASPNPQSNSERLARTYNLDYSPSLDNSSYLSNKLALADSK